MLEKYDVYEWVDEVPVGAKVIDTKWVLKEKREKDSRHGMTDDNESLENVDMIGEEEFMAMLHCTPSTAQADSFER